MSSEIAIKVENLSKCYQIYAQPHDRLKQSIYPRLQRLAGKKPKQYHREFWALKDVSFEIKKGETVGIIGLNGSGKSTLLQMICGTLNPTSGSIQTNGRIAALLELGSGFNPEFTGLENIYMNAAVLGLNKEEIDTRFEKILAFAGIGEFINQPLKTYSSGMVVRLAFSVVAHIDPEILVVDEALAVGDYLFQQKCFKRIDELQKQGCSILLVSHDLSAIVQYCDRAYLLNSGRLQGGSSAKATVDLFKRVTTVKDTLELQTIKNETASFTMFKSSFPVNSAVQDYGNNVAEIYDWAVFDAFGNISTSIDSEAIVEILICIRFLQHCVDPIVGYFFTDVQGREIVGTNTWYARSPLGSHAPGECVEVRFKQILGLSSGEYSLNLGCSEYVGDQLITHHRLYDLCIFQACRLQRNVGFYLPPTDVEIRTLS